MGKKGRQVRRSRDEIGILTCPKPSTDRRPRTGLSPVRPCGPRNATHSIDQESNFAIPAKLAHNKIPDFPRLCVASESTVANGESISDFCGFFIPLDQTRSVKETQTFGPNAPSSLPIAEQKLPSVMPRPMSPFCLLIQSRCDGTPTLKANIILFPQ